MPVVHQTGYDQLQFSNLDVTAVNQEIKNMRIHYFQHVPFEGLGSIEQWIRARGYHLTATKLYQNDPMPEMERVDLVYYHGRSDGSQR